MSEQYGETAFPSDSVTVQSGGTVTVGAAVGRTAGLVGGMDVQNGDATAGEVVTLTNSPQAANAFGEDSELARQVELVFAQGGVNTVYAVGVAETETTDSVTGVSSTTLSNVPVMDPNVNPEHTIDIQDTSEAASVSVDYDYSTPPTTPSSSNTAAVNPVTGEIEFDESSDYDITYTYGEYGTAIDAVMENDPRIMGVCSENEEVLNNYLSVANTKDTDFEFSHGVGGAIPDLSPASYTNNFDDRRLSVLSSSRGYVDAAQTEEVRTVGVVVGKLAGSPLGDSIGYEGTVGLTGLRNSYVGSEISDLLDAGVMPLKRLQGSIKVVVDQNTSSDPRLERVYISEIVDRAADLAHIIAQSFLQENNTSENRTQMENSFNRVYGQMQSDELLEGYAVRVSEGGDDRTVDADIGIAPIDVMDSIGVDITVADTVSFGGVQ